ADATDIDDLFCYEKGLAAPVNTGGDVEMLAAASPAADTVGGVVMPIIPDQPNSFGPLHISVPTRRGVKRTSPDNDTDTDDSNTSDSDTEDYAAGPIGRAGATPKRARWAIPQQAHWDDRNEL
ncbi:MAG TPA: hypothetical protein VJJ83_00435, partial [Candidatus Babeliales bacterium]|nr:hypothetical protein [Candidatus Babeliales bacterium]